MRRSGIAFTSERQLLDGMIPRVPVPAGRLTTRRLSWAEPSATIVWKTLKRLGIAERTVLWNALPMHPHKPGEFGTNRTPTSDELELGREAMGLLHEAFPHAKVVAVGDKAGGLLGRLGLATTASVRHPANGGATLFATQLADLQAGLEA